jgi:hypothetical protein
MDEQQRGSQPGPHEEALASLPEYAAAVALGQVPSAYYPAVAAHIASCPGCRAALETLLELVMPAYTGQVEPAGGFPQFELSFLPPAVEQPAEPRRIWHLDEMRRLVIEFSEALLASRRSGMLAQAARGQSLHRYTLDPPPGNLTATIEVFAGDDPELGNVQVLIDMPGRDPFDQAGIRVTLRVAHRVWEGTTGETGSAIFTAVPLKLLSQLRVEIRLPPEE